MESRKRNPEPSHKGGSQTTKVKHSTINLAVHHLKMPKDETNVPEEEWMPFEVGDLNHIEPPMQFETKINRARGDFKQNRKGVVEKGTFNSNLSRSQIGNLT